MRELLAAMSILALGISGAAADCPEEPLLRHYTGGGTVTCPCFVAGEEAGAIFDAPSEHYPIHIIRIGIGWGSTYGGSPDALEQAIHLYDGGLPNPGVPIYSLEGPILIDGYINEFNVDQLNWIVDSGPFTVTLEFMNSNVGNPYLPSMVHDGNGCQSGCNVVYAIPGGWYDACVLGISGDWVVHVAYRQENCASDGIADAALLADVPTLLSAPRPNPFLHETQIEFYLPAEGPAELSINDALGQRLEILTESLLPKGWHRATWDGTGPDGSRLPAGVYFVNLRAGHLTNSRKVVLNR